MDIQLLLVPYDSGQRGWRCGAGPEHLVNAGLPAHLRADQPRALREQGDAPLSVVAAKRLRR